MFVGANRELVVKAGIGKSPDLWPLPVQRGSARSLECE